MIWLSPLSLPPALALGGTLGVIVLLGVLYQQHALWRKMTRLLMMMALCGAGYDLAALITYSSHTIELSRFWYSAQQVLLSLEIGFYLVIVNRLTGGLPRWIQLFGFSLPVIMIAALMFYPNIVLQPVMSKAVIFGIWKRLEPQPTLFADTIYACAIGLLIFCMVYLLRKWEERDIRRTVLLAGQSVFLFTALFDAATVIFHLPLPYLIEVGQLTILVAVLFVISGDLLTEYRTAAHFNLMRSRIMDNVSHELRTPISVVRGYLEMLGQGRFGSLTTEQLSIVEKARTSADRQIEQVDDLLLAAMIERQGLIPKTDIVDLPEIVTRLSQEFEKRFSHSRNSVSLFIEQYYRVRGDKYLLGKMVQKLLANAFIFGGEDGNIYVSLFVDGDEAGLTIDDQGQGIPEDLLPEIIAPFAQVPDQNVSKGIGLGLSLSAEIINLHGGCLHLANRPNGGLHVEVRLPLDLRKVQEDQGAVPS